MKTLRLLLALLCVLMFAGGCIARINKMMQGWIGHDRNELIARWGPPQQILDDGKGGEILVFTQMRQWTTPGQSTAYTTGTLTPGAYSVRERATTRTTYNPPQTHQYPAYRMFWVNSYGKVYQVSWKGL